jgi:hypothetical protein
MSSTARRSTVAKVVGTIGVVGAAAAVAGLGTFGGFTASTTPVDTSVDAGTLSIDVSQAGSSAPIPATTGRIMPGQTQSFPMDLRNGGDVDLARLVMTSQASASSALDSDPVHGLQLELRSCDVEWTRSGDDYSCAGTAVDLYEGRVLVDQALTGARSLTAGGVDHLLAEVTLPTSGGNTMQGEKSTLSFVFTGTQRGGSNR